MNSPLSPPLDLDMPCPDPCPEQVAGLLAKAGAYLPAEILGLMRQVDWVVVPSIWWENAPTVIEEALIAGRPILS